MRTIIWFIYFWIYLLCIYPQQRYFEKRRNSGVAKEQDIPGIEAVAQLWAQRLLRLAGVSYSVEGLENVPKERAVLFTPNHQGYFDIPLSIIGLGKVNPLIAKKDLERFPFISNWMSLFDCLFLDRENARASLKVFADAQNLIAKEGRSVIIFPEGTRSKGEQLGEFKEGAFKIATKIGAPVVPVCIDGSYKAMEANSMWIRPAHVKITILPLIETSELTREEAKHLGAIVAGRIQACKTQEELDL